ncbi:ABC transporter ATP-binding protein [Caldanaerobius polysaccharolyticus]|uniref:ABC transporter ATP-binding protein n=1 Tax=Caldanaerobius polysaccharolyticus TaxID=44256 RepID=UPI0004787FB9|nr:ABC transporter ATP-binding protein [Caldanaerobius polysaccharolyticus]
MPPLLTLNDLTKTFGGLSAVSNVNIQVHQGEIVGLIGPNGAGKTTVFNLITGVYIPTDGSLTLHGEVEVDLAKASPHEIARMGIARTFQNIRLFKDMTVLDNVLLAFHAHVSYSMWEAILRLPSFGRKEQELREKAVELLKVFNLDKKKDALAKNLPYGEQRRLEIARALALKPRLLLLDEPAAGMNPQESAELMELIKWMRKRFNLTVLLIEHDMSVVMGICERIYVLDYGKLIAEGTPDEIKNNPQVIKAYLGEE